MGISAIGSTGLGLSAAGAASSAVGSYYSSKNQQTNLNYQADIADINANSAENSAQSALLSGQRQEQSVMLRTANLKSNQRTSMAANGIDLGSQTATNILTSTDVMGKIDANTIAANATRTAWGYRTQATNASNTALMDRASASAISPGMSVASSLLTGAGSVASQWYQMNKVGALTPDSTSKSTSDGSSLSNNYLTEDAFNSWLSRRNS